MPCEGRERRTLVDHRLPKLGLGFFDHRSWARCRVRLRARDNYVNSGFRCFIAFQFQFVDAVFYSQKMRQDRCFWIRYIHTLILLSVAPFSINWHAKSTFNTLTLSSTALSLSKLFKEFLSIALTRRSRSIYCGCQGLLNCDECTTLRREKYPNLFLPFWNHWSSL